MSDNKPKRQHFQSISVQLCIYENGELHQVLGKVMLGDDVFTPFEIESQYFPEDGENFSFEHGLLAIGCDEFDVQFIGNAGHHPHWYQAWMKPKEVVGLLHSLQRKGFRCINGLSEIFERFNAKEKFYKRTLKEFLAC